MSLPDLLQQDVFLHSKSGASRLVGHNGHATTSGRPQNGFVGPLKRGTKGPVVELTSRDTREVEDSAPGPKSKLTGENRKLGIRGRGLRCGTIVLGVYLARKTRPASDFGVIQELTQGGMGRSTTGVPF